MHATSDLATDRSTAAELRIDTLRALEELNRAQRAAAVAIHDAVGAPLAGVSIVRMLARREPLTLGEVAAALRVDLSVASRQVTCLVDLGMVERQVDGTDRRIRSLQLTDAGRDLSERISAELLRVSAIAFADWTDDELRAAAEVLDRVAAAMGLGALAGAVDRAAAT
jgi:DNA-binding MarR family transcriptional regulator